eukprot:SAG31_NODE_34106_length_336_cov_0.995781_2_plen_27_part_01
MTVTEKRSGKIKQAHGAWVGWGGERML